MTARETKAGSLAGKKILLGVTGSIAAYKAPLILRLLQAAGATVEVILTESATQFIGAATFSGLGARVHTSLWSGPGELHVALAQWAQIILIAPSTADTLARLTHGRSDDLLTATVLASRARVFVAPALHPSMWSSPVTQENVARLEARGVRFLGPDNGPVASGDIGEGRLVEPERLLEQLALGLADARPLEGRHLVVTAGPTQERLDPVRSLTNESSGKMGFAVAEQAARLGARVTLIAGPVALPTPLGVQRVDVVSALEMEAALDAALGPELGNADALVMAAAVADYRPETVSADKLKRADGPLQLALTPNPDLLANIGRRRNAAHPLLIGFALETAQGDALIALGRRKLIEKRVDLIVANSAADSLGRDDNRVLLVSAQDCKKLEELPKPVVAVHILQWLTARLTQAPSGEFSA